MISRSTIKISLILALLGAVCGSDWRRTTSQMKAEAAAKARDAARKLKDNSRKFRAWFVDHDEFKPGKFKFKKTQSGSWYLFGINPTRKNLLCVAWLWAVAMIGFILGAMFSMPLGTVALSIQIPCFIGSVLSFYCFNDLRQMACCFDQDEFLLASGNKAFDITTVESELGTAFGWGWIITLFAMGAFIAGATCVDHIAMRIAGYSLALIGISPFIIRPIYWYYNGGCERTYLSGNGTEHGEELRILNLESQCEVFPSIDVLDVPKGNPPRVSNIGLGAAPHGRYTIPRRLLNQNKNLKSSRFA